MKKLLVLILTLTVAASLTACAKGKETQTEEQPTPTPTSSRSTSQNSTNFAPEPSGEGYWLGKSFYNEYAMFTFSIPSDKSVKDSTSARDVVIDESMKDNLTYGAKVESSNGAASFLVGAYKISESEPIKEEELFAKFVEIETAKAEKDTAFVNAEQKNNGKVQLGEKYFDKFTLTKNYKNASSSWKVETSYYMVKTADSIIIIQSDVDYSKDTDGSGSAAILKIMNSIKNFEGK